MLVGWTGPRPDLFRDPAKARDRVDVRTAELATDSDVQGFVCGGQRGVDQWAAEAALGHGLALHLVLPAPIDAFAVTWEDADRRTLEELRRHAAPSR